MKLEQSWMGLFNIIIMLMLVLAPRESGGTQNSRQLPKGLFGETSSNVIRSHPLHNHSIL